MEKNWSAPQLISGRSAGESFIACGGSVKMSCGNIMDRISESPEKNGADIEEVDSSDEETELVSDAKAPPRTTFAHQPPMVVGRTLATTMDDATTTSDLFLAVPPPMRDRAFSMDKRIVPSAPVSRRMTLRLDPDDLQDMMQRTSSLRSQMMGQRLMMMLRNFGSHNSLQSSVHKPAPAAEKRRKVENYGFDGITTTLSAMYAKVIVFMGIVLPITDVIAMPAKSQPSFFQGFYLYLYLVSIAYVIFMYASHLRIRAISTLIDKFEDSENGNLHEKLKKRVEHHQCSFYLRVGAIAFGIGSMVYSGLELGQYFELKDDDACQNALVAITPATRVVLCLVQMQLIFISNKHLPMKRYRVISQFGLMHLLATNINEWLYVIIEEAKHEIHHIAEHSHSNGHDSLHNLTKRATATDIIHECRRSNIMGNLVQTAAPFLFPCTIEYSLICAVILFEIWSSISRDHKEQEETHAKKDAHQISINCSGSQRGMFGGILVLVLTIISLIMYFVLSKEVAFYNTAIKEVTICESFIYCIMIGAVVLAMLKMRQLRFSSKRKNSNMSTDCLLLLVAQTGVYIYVMFSIIGCYFQMRDSHHEDPGASTGILAELFCILETTMQTIFIMNSWWRRIKGSHQIKEKPGRQYITFLLIANICMWTINTLIKGRAGFRPQHMDVFGIWAWTIITHVSMPMAIFYRFHSSICLYEIWKTVYKMKVNQANINFKKGSILSHRGN